MSASKINEATPVTQCADSAARALAQIRAPSGLQTISLRDCLSRQRLSGRRSDERENYENFLPAALFPVSRAGVNGETAGALFFLFLSAFGFFFSRLLLN
jgi:hypothetical protein